MGDDKNFQELIHRDAYQVFLFTSPGNVPFNFAVHPWLVINKQGVISRWEVLFRKMEHETRWGHVYKNFFPPFRGIEILPFSQKYFWEGKLLGHIEGEVAQRMADFIENSPTTYPYYKKYLLTGPNSNTYVQWVLNNFPEFRVQLPWNAFGKNYGVK